MFTTDSATLGRLTVHRKSYIAACAATMLLPMALLMAANGRVHANDAAPEGSRPTERAQVIAQAIAQFSESRRLYSLERFKESSELCKSVWITLEKELGPNDKQTIQVLISLAFAYQGSGDHSASLECFEDVLERTEGEEGLAPLRLRAALEIGKSRLNSESFVEAERAYAEAHRIKTSVLREKDLFAVRVLYFLSVSQRMQGKSSDRMESLKIALAIYRDSPEKDPSLAMDVIGALGESTLDAEKPTEAIELLNECLGLCEATDGRVSTSSAYTSRLLARAHGAAGNTIQAKEVLTRRLAILQELPSAKGSEVGSALAELAGISCHLCEFDEMESYATRYLELAKQMSPPSIQHEANANSCIAVQLLSQGRFDAARLHVDRALDLLKPIADANPAQWSAALQDAAGLESGLGHYRRSVELVNQALDFSRKLQSPKVSTAMCLAQLARARTRLGEFEEAAQSINEALEILNPSDDCYVYEETYLSLVQGSLYVSLNRCDEAERSLANVLASFPSRLPLVNDIRASALIEMGLLRQQQGELGEAKTHLSEAKEIRVKMFGERHCETAEAYDELGQLLAKTKEVKQAREYLELAKEVRRESLGKDHPDYADSLLHLGLLEYEERNYSSAASLLEDAAKLYVTTLGADHPKSIEAQKKLALAAEHVARKADAS
jgi:tetratricopeptide (TPR) repeat protein